MRAGSGLRKQGEGAGTRSRLDLGGAQVVRRPPRHPSGEGEGLTCFRGGSGLVASQREAEEVGETTPDFR
jgi:hypothetical protein